MTSGIVEEEDTSTSRVCEFENVDRHLQLSEDQLVVPPSRMRHSQHFLACHRRSILASAVHLHTTVLREVAARVFGLILRVLSIGHSENSFFLAEKLGRVDTPTQVFAADCVPATTFDPAFSTVVIGVKGTLVVDNKNMLCLPCGQRWWYNCHAVWTLVHVHELAEFHHFIQEHIPSRHDVRSLTTVVVHQPLDIFTMPSKRFQKRIHEPRLDIVV